MLIHVERKLPYLGVFIALAVVNSHVLTALDVLAVQAQS